jgi:hypothetical protein
LLFPALLHPPGLSRTVPCTRHAARRRRQQGSASLWLQRTRRPA